MAGVVPLQNPVAPYTGIGSGVLAPGTIVGQGGYTGPSSIIASGGTGYSGVGQSVAPGSGTGTGTGSGSGTAVPQATIDAIMAGIANHIAQNQQDFTTAQGENAASDAQGKLTYDNQVHTNNASHGTAIQNAEQAAAQGNQGLQAILASMGALGGTGKVLAGRAVANSANNDIGGADQNYQANANAIDLAQKGYETAAHNRDAALQSSLDTDNKNAQNAGYQTILNSANSAGDQATYNKFLPQLVQSTAPTQAIHPQAVLSNPANVNSYAPTSGLKVTSAPAVTQSSTTPVNSALYLKKTE